eukprot:GHVN01034100.1.p1 GENE.GHVN01034100.1~~GHVN01034100.1.p1  ORF type:complete len:101 (+),score=12.53 GHVN01034100.1:542-844(+)
MEMVESNIPSVLSQLHRDVAGIVRTFHVYQAFPPLSHGMQRLIAAVLLNVVGDPRINKATTRSSTELLPLSEMVREVLADNRMERKQFENLIDIFRVPEP